MIWKIENDNLYRTTYLSRDHNNDSLAEIIEGIEIENGKIILQNILGDIYILDKNEKYKEKEIKKFCELGAEEKEYLRRVFNVKKLSARTYHKVLKVARTIADMAMSETIKIEHLVEACNYRSLEDKVYH